MRAARIAALAVPAVAALVAFRPAAAIELELPGPATRTAESVIASEVALPAGPWTEAGMEVERVAGRVARRAWRLGASDLTPAQLAARLAAQLSAAGYSPVYDCAAAACGGFDFRFELPLFPAPDMHVDLGDFRYLLARDGAGALAALVVSRGGGSAYVQLIEATPGQAAAEEAAPRAAPGAAPGAAPPPPSQSPSQSLPQPLPQSPAASGDLASDLARDGRIILSDLRFASGSAALAPGPYASLDALAAWLAETPEARITLVGHTDAAGGLAANLAISRARAQAVRSALVALGADPARVAAEGAAYLAPIAGNGTEEGRARNRRVEAIRDDTG